MLAGTLYFMLGDHLGSTSLVTSASGLVVSQTQYKAWGEVRYNSGTNPMNYTYTGQYSYAADFGLMFYNARWYDSSLGRFAQADTIVPARVQGYDRYAYVNNNPVRYTDPSGHIRVEDKGGSTRGCSDPIYCRNGRPKPFDELKLRQSGSFCATCHNIFPSHSKNTPIYTVVPTWTPTPPCPQGPSNCKLKLTTTPAAPSNCPSGQTCMGQQPLINTPVEMPTPFLRDVVTNPTVQSVVVQLSPDNPFMPDLEMPEGHFINMNQLWEDMYRIVPPFLGYPAQNIPLTTWPIIIINPLMKGPFPIFIIPQDPFNKIVT